jgi:hypothetical protein
MRAQGQASSRARVEVMAGVDRAGARRRAGKDSVQLMSRRAVAQACATPDTFVVLPGIADQPPFSM